MAARLPIEPVNELGDLVAKPAANGFLELVSLRVPSGKKLLCSLVQGLEWSVPGDPTLAPAGFTWKARVLEGGSTDSGTPRDLVFRKKGALVPWTLADGRSPVIRNVLVEAGVTIQWGIEVSDHTAIPAELAGFYGGIVGFLCDEDFVGRPEFYALLSKP